MAEPETVIRVENLGKKYQLAHRAEGPRYEALRDVLVHAGRHLARRLRHPFQALQGTSSREEFWALKDVSFEVKRGEVVGIIGRNGAGKSTLLKILSRITEPTTGRVTLHGRVASLLEVGTGFHPELTGRENIYLNGAILGMSRAEIKRKFDEIVAFAEVEKFLDTPVKRYSSGMYVRLAFAVAAHLEPKILVVDEVLAVGDIEFQKKCLGKLGELTRGSRTILLVSHNMAVVQRICSRAILLRQGTLSKDGAPADVTADYLASSVTDASLNLSQRRLEPSRVRIVDAWLERSGRKTSSFLLGEAPDVFVEIEISERTAFSVELLLRQQDGLPVAFSPSGLANDWELDLPPGQATVRCRLPPIVFACGSYAIDIILAITGKEFLDYVESALIFDVQAAVGARNWVFSQSRGQGCLLWDVQYKLEHATGQNGIQH